MASEPFNPPATPWVGDVWGHKELTDPRGFVDIVDILQVGGLAMVAFENRGRTRRVRKMPLKDFLRVYGPKTLVEVRPKP